MTGIEVWVSYLVDSYLVLILVYAITIMSSYLLLAYLSARELKEYLKKKQLR